MPSLLILTGEGAGESFEFSGDITMGRSSSASFAVKDYRASRYHAKIRCVNGEYRLEDMDSHNGTYLNGKKILGESRLKTNDNIRIGVTWLLFTASPGDLEVGDIFCGYKIEKKIRKDQTGILYEAHQESLDRDVILWVICGDCWEGEEAITRENFFSEIRKIAKLFHRNILMLLDFGASSNFLYCAFEHIETNFTVRKWISSYEHSHPPINEALDIACQIASAMSYAHRQKVLHLHLTTDNILIRKGHKNRVIITEFGFSRFLSEASSNSMTTTGILGISEYIAPEQIDCSEPPSVASDIYSFGCILYHVLGGVAPFAAGSPYQMMEYHTNYDPPPITKHNSDIPKPLSDFIHKMIAKQPKHRYSSFRDIGELVEKFRREEEIKAILNTEYKKGLGLKKLDEKIGWRWWVILPAIAIVILFVIGLLLRI